LTTRRLPVRWRLTLWFAALLALVMALFGGAIYVVLRQELYANFDDQLLNQASLMLAAVRVEDGTPTLDPSMADVVDGEYFLRLFNAEGTTLFETEGGASGILVDRDVIAASLDGRTEYSAALDEDNEILRLISVPVRADNGEGVVSGVLQVGLDRDEIDEPLAGLLGALILAGPVVLLFAAAGGYLLAGRALSPVATITDLAARIGAGDLRSRLNLDLPDDELGRLARTFDAMLARIEDAFERQRRFTDDAAHELRTPLSLMRSQVDLALARPRSRGEYQEALQAFDGDIARMTALLGTLLTLARSDAGKLAVEPAPFDLADTVRLVLEQYAPVAAEAGVSLQDETASASLVADEDLLMQLLINLIDNALAHTPPGGAVVAGCRPDDGSIRLWVGDTGDGIATEHQDRVFDRFYRIDAGRSRDRGGTGLGLAICKAIAEAHGGTISLMSRLGSGTRVEVVLPDGQPHA
jgi:heavy metal sensor kinase